MISITDPGKLGCVLLSSETPDKSASEIVQEFNIERVDDYFTQATAHR